MNYLKSQNVIKMKTCSKCKQIKAFTGFYKNTRNPYGLKSRCKVCVIASNKKYAQNNPEKVKARSRKCWEKNREKYNARHRKRNQRPEVKKKRNARLRERRNTDPQFKLANSLRCLTYQALRGNIKSASTIALLGCSISHLIEHLEKQFQPGMTWENKGTWHLDHMMPVASFDLSDPEQQRQCCHYTNFQPMWGRENIIKGDKILYKRVWTGTKWINNI